jgi:hypothetical protein
MAILQISFCTVWGAVIGELGGEGSHSPHHSHLSGRPSARPQQQHQRGFWPSPQSTIRFAKASSFEISTVKVVKIFCTVMATGTIRFDYRTGLNLSYSSDGSPALAVLRPHYL